MVFQQLAENFDQGIRDCGAFVDINGVQTCQAEKVEGLVNSAGPKSFDEYSIDHVYPLPIGVDGTELPVVTLYGELGSDEFAKFHQVLKALAKKGSIKYLFRHFSKVNFV